MKIEDYLSRYYIKDFDVSADPCVQKCLEFKVNNTPYMIPELSLRKKEKKKWKWGRLGFFQQNKTQWEFKKIKVGVS